MVVGHSLSFFAMLCEEELMGAGLGPMQGQAHHFVSALTC